MRIQLGKHRTRIQACAEWISILAALVIAVAIASPAQTFTIIKQFTVTTGGLPPAPPVEAFDGNLYGTNRGFGQHSSGTVYKLAPAGLKVIHDFCTNSCFDGGDPAAGLTLGSDGTLYGTTSSGGANLAGGEVFRITTKGTFTQLYSFCSASSCSDGQDPRSGLIQGNDGYLYGTTNGDPNGHGTVFRIGTSPGGGLTTLYSFCASAGCADGSVPQGTLVQGTDGNFYGTTEYGGANNQGTIFRISLTGALTTLYSFCALANCPDGATPIAGVVEGADGNFYGTTSTGGIYTYCAGGCGTIFKFTQQGALTTLHSFTFPSVEGVQPNGLMQATDGNLYGTTFSGGAHNKGAIFQIATGGTFTLLYSFSVGKQPLGGLMQSTDGTFYGTTQVGGKNNGGILYRLSMGLGPFVKVLPAGTTVGQTVAIVGNNLPGTTSVTFNGIPSSFVDVYTPTLIYATVPSGATTGPVQVTTPSGVLTSNVAFQVLP